MQKIIPPINISKINKYLGHFGFLVLAILAFIFYQERVVFIDTIFQFFKIVNLEKFNIEAARYGTFITEIPLLIAIKLGAGLKTLAMVYSLSFVLVYYLVFLLCTYTFKNPAAGLAILFSIIICISHSFFHPSTETHQAIVYTILLFAILQHPFKKLGPVLKYSLAVLIVILCFFCHPVALFTVLFVIGFHLVDLKKWNDKGLIILTFLVLLLAFIKLQLTADQSYEGNFFNELLNLNINLSHLFNIYSLYFFLSRIPSLYVGIIILFSITLLIWFLKKEYLKLTYLVISTLGFFIITVITYAKGDADVMMERSFMPLTIFMVLPFFNAANILKKQRHLILIASLLVFIFVISVARISNEGKRYTQRIKYVEELISETKSSPSRKFLLQITPENNQKISYTWPFSFTTMVISSFDGPENTRTIYLYDKIDNYLKYTTSDYNTIFLGANFWLEWHSNELNQKYFRLPNESYSLFKDN